MTEEYITVIGIDPGTSCLGFAAIKYCLSSHAMLLDTAFTLHPRVAAIRKGIAPGTVGLRPVRLNVLHDQLVKEFCKHEPTMVASESPYLGRFPKAFAALVECVLIERRALYEYDPEKVLGMITPSTVKVSAGVSHTSSDKEDMRKAALTLKDVDFGNVDITLLDEHAIDAIHVARCAILQARGIVIPFVKVKKPKKPRKPKDGKPKRRKSKGKKGRR